MKEGDANEVGERVMMQAELGLGMYRWSAPSPHSSSASQREREDRPLWRRADKELEEESAEGLAELKAAWKKRGDERK